MILEKITKRNLVLLSAGITSLALVVAIFLHGYFGFFSRFLADDYCLGWGIKSVGFFHSLTGRYAGWDGRYAFTFIAYGLELLGDKVVTYIPLISICLWLISTFYLIKQIGKKRFSKQNFIITIFLSTVFVFIGLYTMPSVGQDVYWFTGNTTYFFPIIFEMFTIGVALNLSMRAKHFTKMQQLFFSALLFLLAFITSGFSEVATTLSVTFFGMILGIEIFKKVINKETNPSFLYWCAAFAGAFIGLLVMILAPGNSIRQQLYPPHPSIVTLISQSLVISWDFFVSWVVQHYKIIIATMLTVLFFGVCVPLPSIFNFAKKTKNRILYFLLFIVIFLLFFILSFMPTYWALSTATPERVAVIPSIILSALIVSLSFLLGVEIQQKIPFKLNNSLLISAVLPFICVCFIVVAPYHQALNYFHKNHQTAVTFANKWDSINSSILTAKSEGQKIITTEINGFNIMGIEHLQSDPSYWMNRCAAGYYQVDEIIAR
jgi:hypothetical protein